MDTKTIKKYSKKVYKKVPKKKIAKKAAAYGLEQAVGGPYLTFLNFVFKKSKKKVLSYAGDYAYDRFFRSSFARQKINTIPIAVFSLIIRMILNFLLFSRLKIGIAWLDFVISMIITIIITVMAPIFYTSVSVHEDGFMRYTNTFIDNFLGPNGWDYVEDVKNKVVGVISIFLIMVLQIVEVNSRMLQLMIIHTVITGFVAGRIQIYMENMNKISIVYYGMEMINPEIHYVKEILLPMKKAKRCHTKNRVIKKLRPCRAEIVCI